MPSEQKATAEPPKGMFALFGSSLPKKNDNVKAESKLTLKKPAEDRAGGAWQTVKRKNLALKASRTGKTVSVEATRTSNPEKEDADVEMGVGGKSKRNRKRFSPYARGGRAHAKEKTMDVDPGKRVEVLIAGFPPGTEQGLVPFLQIKTKKAWEPVDVKVEQGQMLLTVTDPVIARAITRLNGYLYLSEQLQVHLYNEVGLKPTDEPTVRPPTTMDHLRSFLHSRWHKDARFLNLDAMASDPILKKAGIKAPGAPGSNTIVGPAMFKLASEMFGEVVTISFGNNRFRNAQPISTITQFLPSVQNLSFKDNLIKDFAGIESLSGTGKLAQLRELVLLGNPISESAMKFGTNQSYVRNIVRRFPSLVILDSAPVVLSEDDITSIQKRSSVLPLDTQGNSFDNETSQSTTFDFLSKFYPLFDAKDKRAELEALYAPNACFSLSTSIKLRSKSKVRRREKKAMMEDDTEVSWKTVSRNLATATSEKSIGKGLLCGPEAIVSLLHRLPPTIHDFSRPGDFVVDGYQHAAGLQITLHGEFKEDGDDLPYSFDRTFILRPAVEGSPAMAAGWQYTIVSDLLVVRDYVGNQGFQPQVPVVRSIFESMPSLSAPPLGC